MKKIEQALDNLKLEDLNDLFTIQLRKRKVIHLVAIMEGEETCSSIVSDTDDKSFDSFLNLLSTLLKTFPALSNVLLNIILEKVLTENKEMLDLANAYMERMQKTNLN